MTIGKIAMLASVAGSLFASSSSSALAWGCRAEGRGSSYGYSYNFDNRRAAEYRALRECARRPGAGRCFIVFCERRA